jgi:hypothetical protein
LPQEANSVTERPSTVASFAQLIWHRSLSDSSSKRKAVTEVAGFIPRAVFYAAFFAALSGYNSADARVRKRKSYRPLPNGIQRSLQFRTSHVSCRQVSQMTFFPW